MRRLSFLAPVVLLACRRDAAHITADDAVAVAEVAAPVPSTLPAEVVTRLRGPIKGGFRLQSPVVEAGAPIFVDLEVTNTSPDPFSFDVGGDYRGTYMPLRYGVMVHDATKKKVCDLRENPPMSLGGLGSARRLGSGETFRERFVLNSACDALLVAGTYRVTLVRRLSQQMLKPPTDAGMCDDELPTEILPKTTTPACRAFLDAAPQVVSEIDLHVRPWDAAKLATVLKPFAIEAVSYKDIGEKWERTLYMQWMCRRITCGCAKLASAADVAPYMEDVIKRLPATPPAKCP